MNFFTNYEEMAAMILFGIGFTTLLLAAAVAAVAVYLLYDPSQSALFPRCPFLMLTGLKCPGCGSQRVIHSLLGGDIAAAWHYNAFMVAALPVIALYSYAELRRRRGPDARPLRHVPRR